MPRRAAPRLSLRKAAPSIKQRYANRMQASKKLLGGRCLICGSNRQLEFHHIDPRLKKHHISVLCLGQQYATTLYYKELSKCILLCDKCHDEVHSKA